MYDNKEKINILHLRDSPWVDGPGRTIIETGARIEKNRYGYFIGALCNSNILNHPFVETAKQKNLKVISIVESGRFDPNIINQILSLIDKEKIDILHTHEVRSNIAGLICAKIRRKAIIATLHGWIANSIKGKFYTNLDKYILRSFNHIIAVSAELKKNVTDCGIPEDKISILHNALVTEDYLSIHNGDIFRRDIGVEENEILVGNIGRLSPEKGQRDFIYGAREVLKHDRNVKFVLIGSGPDQNRLEKLVRELEIQDHVIFAGYRKDMVKVYKGLDLVVQSSYTEGMPNIILEALIMEVPVIATEVGGTAEIIEHGVTGILVRPGMPDIIASNILKYLENRNHLKSMAKAGSSIIRNRFNIRERTKKLEMIYEEIMKKGNDKRES